MTTAAFDPLGWVEQLQRHGVEYVLVGGFAGVLHGARRPTVDIDVVPRWEEENLRRLCAALREAGAWSTTGPRVEADTITPAVLIDREVMTWQTDLGRIDTLVGIPDGEGMPVDYDQLESRALAVAVEGTDVVVASLDDVITSKQYASRRKDAEALPELRRLRDQRQQSD